MSSRVCCSTSLNSQFDVQFFFATNICNFHLTKSMLACTYCTCSHGTHFVRTTIETAPRYLPPPFLFPDVHCTMSQPRSTAAMLFHLPPPPLHRNVRFVARATRGLPFKIQVQPPWMVLSPLPVYLATAQPIPFLGGHQFPPPLPL